MDVLKNESYRTYDYISRYASYPYFYNVEDCKYVYGLTGQIDRDITFVSYEVKQGDTLDALALKYYGRPDYYWVIADFNSLTDCLDELYPRIKNLKIPALSAVSFENHLR